MKRIAIVTSASPAAGRRMAQRLADRGYSVAVSHVGTAGQAAPAGEIEAADVARDTGPVDLVFHDSGIMPLSAIRGGDIDRFFRVIGTDLGEKSHPPRPATRRREVVKAIMRPSSRPPRTIPTRGSSAASRARAERLAQLLADALRGRKVTVTVVEPRAGPLRSRA
jgi:NAD(P)-dependent dehydrogenase (short-subunit alcohol dehydrogenase family)